MHDDCDNPWTTKYQRFSKWATDMSTCNIRRSWTLPLYSSDQLTIKLPDCDKLVGTMLCPMTLQVNCVGKIKVFTRKFP